MPRKHIRALHVTLTLQPYDSSDPNYEVGRERECVQQYLKTAVGWLNALLGLSRAASAKVTILVKVIRIRVALQLEHLLTSLAFKMRRTSCELIVLHDLD